APRKGLPAVSLVALGVCSVLLIIAVLTFLAVLGIKSDKIKRDDTLQKSIVEGTQKYVSEDGERTRRTLSQAASQKDMLALADSMAKVADIIVSDGERTRRAIADENQKARAEDRSALSKTLDDLSAKLADVRTKVDASTAPPPRPQAVVRPAPLPAPSGPETIPVSQAPASQQATGAQRLSSLYSEDDLRPVSLGTASSRADEFIMYELGPGRLSREFSAREIRAGRVSVSAKYGLRARVFLGGWRSYDIDVPSNGGFVLPADATGISFYSETETFSIRLKR
ncbi:MAG TPA: hypothetical protein VHD69_01230, partial [Candidatus Paceibacterota bacterium]|nr:hypothetical protein [Candidatus Paceibacterota bacterium]